jgi:acetyl esterase/lipase
MRKLLKACLMAALFAAPLLHGFPAAGAEKSVEDLRRERLSVLPDAREIVYKNADGADLLMTLFPPARPPPGAAAPLVIYIHGGGWTKGSRLKIADNPTFGTLRRLNQSGVACAAVEYRLVKKGRTTAMDSVTDCKDAAAYLVKNAESLGIDPKRFAVWGDSAGGHLALLTALADDKAFPSAARETAPLPRPRCAVALYPLASLTDPDVLRGGMFDKPGSASHLLGGPAGEKKAEAEALSPVRWLGKDSPPLLLIHGGDDTVLGAANSLLLAGRAKQRGADVTLLMVKNAGHGLSGRDIEPSLEEITRRAADFMTERLASGGTEQKDCVK